MKSTKTKLKPGEISRHKAYSLLDIQLRDPVKEAKLRLKEDLAIEKEKSRRDAALEKEMLNPCPLKPSRRSVDGMYQLARQIPPFITMQRCTYDNLEQNNNAGIKALLKDNFPAFMNVNIKDVVFYVGLETVEFRLVGRKRSYPSKS